MPCYFSGAEAVAIGWNNAILKSHLRSLVHRGDLSCALVELRGSSMMRLESSSSMTLAEVGEKT